MWEEFNCGKKCRSNFLLSNLNKTKPKKKKVLISECPVFLLSLLFAFFGVGTFKKWFPVPSNALQKLVLWSAGRLLYIGVCACLRIVCASLYNYFSARRWCFWRMDETFYILYNCTRASQKPCFALSIFVIFARPNVPWRGINWDNLLLVLSVDESFECELKSLHIFSFKENSSPQFLLKNVFST